MELKKIESQTIWEVASDAININSAKVNEAVTRLENATIKSKGYYKTLVQLQEALPSASNGSWAFVGTSYPFQIYNWDGNAWVDSGILGGDESLNLTDYYTKEEAMQMFVGSDNVRFIETRYTEEQINQMHEDGTADPNTLYIALAQ